MIETALKLFLGYLTFVRPVVYGAQLCKAEQPNSRLVTNTVLALLFGWLMEIADSLFLSSFIAARTLYVAGRIVLALYLSHPTFLGALTVYEKVFAQLVETYGPVVDAMLMQHLDAIGQSGIVNYGTTVGMALFRAVMEVVDIGRRLMEASAATEVPAAALPRRLSTGRAEPPSATDEDDDSGPTSPPEEQYVTASVIAKVRQAASEQSPPPVAALYPHGGGSSSGYDSAAPERQFPSPPPPPVERLRPRPPPPPPAPQHYYASPPYTHSSPADYDTQEDEEDYFEESLSGRATPPAVHRRGDSGAYRHPHH